MSRNSLTIREITARLNEVLQNREKNGVLQPEDYVWALNQATGGNWSSRTNTESDRDSGLGEILRLIVNLGDDPNVRTTVEITVPAADGMVTRQGWDEGTTPGRWAMERMEKEALARAIATMRTGK